MPVTRPYVFDETFITVVNREDGQVHLELRDEEGGSVVGVVPFTPDSAIAVGRALVEKGTNLRNEMQALADAANAWRDRIGRTWYGNKGADLMSPADGELDDHSWNELVKHFGPLTPIGDDR